MASLVPIRYGADRPSVGDAAEIQKTLQRSLGAQVLLCLVVQDSTYSLYRLFRYSSRDLDGVVVRLHAQLFKFVGRVHGGGVVVHEVYLLPSFLTKHRLHRSQAILCLDLRMGGVGVVHDGAHKGS
jgi:hypothetical protein